MSKTSRITILVVVLVGGVLGQSLSATTTVAVGPSTCLPHLVHFATIQAAVNAVPFNTIVEICPGTYPEQVVINEPLTLKGVTDGTGNAAIITVPAGGLVVNATSAEFGPVTAQVLAQNTVGVNISNITVDGTGGTCVAGANRTVGIEYYNVGTSVDGTTAGKLLDVVVRNEIDGCDLGEGILADGSYITITANEVHDIDRTGIVTNKAKTSITSNSVQNTGNYGVVADFDAGSLISGNTISNAVGFAGIIVEDGGTATDITKNTLVNTSYVGIWLDGASHISVTQNIVSNATWPMVLEFVSQSTVQNNTFKKASADGILDELSLGGNIVTRNTVNEAAFGIFTDSTAVADTLVPNSLFNVVVTVDPSPTDSPNPADSF